MSKQKSAQQSNGAPAPGTRSIRAGAPADNGLENNSRLRRPPHPGSANLLSANYGSVRGEDVENEMYLSELNILGENR